MNERVKAIKKLLLACYQVSTDIDVTTIADDSFIILTFGLPCLKITMNIECLD